MHFTQPLHQRHQNDPDALFSVCEGRETTNAEAIDRVSRIAGWLRRVGVSSGDRVAFLDFNTDHFLLTALGIAWADAVLVPVNFRWSVPEIVYSLRDADVEVLFLGDGFLHLADDLRQAMPELRVAAHLGVEATPAGLVTPAEILAVEPVADVERGGDSLWGIFYTGGTTGEPKGVMLSHRGAFVSALGSSVDGGFQAGGSHLAVAPAFHLAGLAGIVIGMMLDQTIVMVPGFDPEKVMALIEQYKVSHTLLVPTMIQMIVDHPSRENHDLSSLRSMMYGASPISEALLDRLRAALPTLELTQMYGMTELSPVTTVLSNADHQHPTRRNGAGKAVIHARVRIVDENDREVPRGQVGEVCAKGEHVMLGYWKKPDLTAEALRDGWMHTGDGGYMDADGYVYLVDRIKDMIISGGENVYSIEVENVIARHPAVLQCAVIGLPDEKWGERVHAVVQLRPGGQLDAEELREFCKQSIAGYKAPQTMEVIDAWPLSAAGKILKRELRAQRIAQPTRQLASQGA